MSVQAKKKQRQEDDSKDESASAKSGNEFHEGFCSGFNEQNSHHCKQLGRNLKIHRKSGGTEVSEIDAWYEVLEDVNLSQLVPKVITDCKLLKGTHLFVEATTKQGKYLIQTGCFFVYVLSLLMFFDLDCMYFVFFICCIHLLDSLKMGRKVDSSFVLLYLLIELLYAVFS